MTERAALAYQSTTMNKSFLLALLFLIACGPHFTLLVNPITGALLECRAGVNIYGGAVGQGIRETCVQQYSAAGYIEVDKLTPEQRAHLTEMLRSKQQQP